MASSAAGESASNSASNTMMRRDAHRPSHGVRMPPSAQGSIPGRMQWLTEHGHEECRRGSRVRTICNRDSCHGTVWCRRNAWPTRERHAHQKDQLHVPRALNLAHLTNSSEDRWAPAPGAAPAGGGLLMDHDGGDGRRRRTPSPNEEGIRFLFPFSDLYPI